MNILVGVEGLIVDLMWPYEKKPSRSNRGTSQDNGIHHYYCYSSDIDSLEERSLHRIRFNRKYLMWRHPRYSPFYKVQ